MHVSMLELVRKSSQSSQSQAMVCGTVSLRPSEFLAELQQKHFSWSQGLKRDSIGVPLARAAGKIANIHEGRGLAQVCHGSNWGRII